MATFKWILIAAVVGYGGLLAAMYLFQRALLYFPDATRTTPAQAGLPQAEEIVLTSADGERLIGWHVAPRGLRPVVIYFQGNAGGLNLRAERFGQIVADGTGLLALSYRGYGGSSGSPSEPGLLADAAAAYTFAAARYGSGRIVLWGESLGTAVAVALAATHPVGRLLLESPFSSAVDVGAAVYWFMPVRLLMKDQFRSDRRIGRVTAPVLILHGADDRVVPLAFGEKLFALANEPKRLVRIAGGGHGDLDAHGALAVARPFIAEAAR